MKSYQDNLYQVQQAKVNFTHNLTQIRVQEQRIDLDWTVLRLKQFCESKFGSQPSEVSLVVQDLTGNPICSLNDNS